MGRKTIYTEVERKTIKRGQIRQVREQYKAKGIKQVCLLIAKEDEELFFELALKSREKS